LPTKQVHTQLINTKIPSTLIKVQNTLKDWKELGLAHKWPIFKMGLVGIFSLLSSAWSWKIWIFERHYLKKERSLWP